MDRFWFHQCIQGLLSLATIRTRDVRAFTNEHPYQSNIRFIEARQDGLGKDPLKSLQGALQVPDRRALYDQINSSSVNEGLALPDRVYQDDPDAQTVGHSETTQDVAQEVTPSPLLRMLPVYIRPEQEVATVDEETDEEWEHLEERLQEEDASDEEESDLPEMSSDQGDPPPAVESASGSIFDKFDTHIDARGFGVVQEEDHQSGRNFVDWVTSLDEDPATAVNSFDDEDQDRKKSSKKLKKKKKKHKKEAKRLAKLSVQKKQVVATETLAELLTRQGHHQDAIDMYERLCLIVPEKKAIFAARIESIKSSHP